MVKKTFDVWHIIYEDIPSPGSVLWGVMNGVKHKFLFCKKKKKPTKCASVGDWLNWCAYTMEYDSAIKSNELLIKGSGLGGS